MLEGKGASGAGGNEGRGCLVSRRQGLNVAAGSATNDQARDYIAAPSISAQKPPPLPARERVKFASHLLVFRHAENAR